MTTANVELKRFLEVDLARFPLVFRVETEGERRGETKSEVAMREKVWNSELAAQYGSIKVQHNEQRELDGRVLFADTA